MNTGINGAKHILNKSALEEVQRLNDDTLSMVKKARSERNTIALPVLVFVFLLGVGVGLLL